MSRSSIDRQHQRNRAKLDSLISSDKAWRKANARTAEQEAAEVARWRDVLAGRDELDTLSAEAFTHPPKVKVKRTKAEKRKHRRDEYERYINSPEWRAFRLTVFAQRGRKCQKCGKDTGVIHIHHLSYRRFGHEKPKDVRVLCEECHAIVHGRGKAAAARWGKEDKRGE